MRLCNCCETVEVTDIYCEHCYNRCIGAISTVHNVINCVITPDETPIYTNIFAKLAYKARSL